MKIFLPLTALLTGLLINSPVLDSYNFDKPEFVFQLDMGLNEISGLAVDESGRVFAHNDEIGGIFELDRQNGKIIKWFYLGPNRIKEDFEGLAIAGEEFYLVTSAGVLYKFYDQPDGKYSQFTKIQTGITGSFEIEGLCYDPKTNSLLLASKKFAGRDYKDSRAVYSFNLKTGKLSEKPRFVISLNELKKKYKVNDLALSGIEADKRSGNFLILSSGERGIVEISPTGRLVNYRALDKEYHLQPEGITILGDGTLIIGDESSGGKPKLTGYKKK